MKLGVIGAMALEVEALRAAMENSSSFTLAGMEFQEGTLRGCPAVVVQSGVGKVNAALCAQILCTHFQVSAIINTGVAGSLDPALDIGDILISTDAMYHDFNVSPLGYAPGQVPGMDTLAFPTDPFLAAKARDACRALSVAWKEGRVASGDQFICEKAVKERIISLTGASCTEMEGAAIAHAAYRNHIPCLILRAISDKADDSAEMDYPTFERKAAQVSAGLVEYMAEHF